MYDLKRTDVQEIDTIVNSISYHLEIADGKPRLLHIRKLAWPGGSSDIEIYRDDIAVLNSFLEDGLR